MRIFAYEFMLNAFLIALAISIIAPLVGNIVVLKRLSNIGDALSHSCLAGVCVGLIIQKNPIFFAVIASVIAALLIELLRHYFARYSEIATSIITSFSIGMVAILSGFVKEAKDLDGFMFGSIVSVSDGELIGVMLMAIVVIVVCALYYREILYITFDEEAAKIASINTNFINILITVITSVVVSISSRTVGALVISSLLIIPVACSLQISKSYFTNLIYSIIFAMFFTISGLFISFYSGLKTGGTIVIIGVAVLIVIIFFKEIKKGRYNIE